MSITVSSVEVQAGSAGVVDLEPIDGGLYTHELVSMRRRSDAVHTEEATASPQQLVDATPSPISNWSATLLIGNVACISLINSMLGGLLVVSLPTMARDIGLSDALILWPASVNALSCGCTLLLFGSVADIVGGRKMYLIGSFCLTLTTIACAVCKTGIQLILFRAAQGVALSLCLPSSVMIITKNIPTGTWRNNAFACLGAGQPIGFSVGLVLGGVFVQSIGWRYGYYIGAILIFLIFIVSIFGIPADPVFESQSFPAILKRLKTEIDWTGCFLISTSLGMFSYVLSVLAGNSSHFKEPASITLFSIALILIPIFAFHIRRQERLGRKVIIPPSLFGNRVFTSLCLTVFVIWGVFNSIQYFLTLFYQTIQSLSAIQTSLRFLPMVVTGGIANFVTGLLVKRVRADVLVLGSGAITAISPLLMAIVDPKWSYWTCAFFVTAFTPICADVLFTIANLLITSVFPPQTHGLAGGVFNTVSNIGNSVGLAITAVVASGVTLGEKGPSAEILMDGYRASYWLCFGANISALAVVAFGLRKIGKVGIKID
jgi:MFS family permease